MKKIILCIFASTSFNLFSQEIKKTEEKEDTELLTIQKFNCAIKTEFNGLIGNSVSNVNNSFATNFDKKESSIKADFTFSPNNINRNSYRHSFTGSIKFGESSNIFDFGKSEMPLLNLAFKYNILAYRIWFYDNNSDGKRIWTHKRYLWFSPQISYDNNKYTIYDNSRSIDSQVYKEKYSKLSGSISGNFYAYWTHEKYRWRLRPTYFYFQVNYEYKKGNNIDSFDQVEINDYISESNGTAREISKRTIAYQGNYTEKKQQNLNAEMLIGINKNVSLDVFGKQSITDKNDSYIGAGLYFLVKNSKQEPTVNFGVFLQKNKDKEAFIGFKTSIPINL